MNITSKIKEIRYTPLLCDKLNTFSFMDLSNALSKATTFILKIDEGKQIVLSWWVSAKRTRSYPYARVYNSLFFVGMKATIIPIMKDEGKDGDRDFLQWDTISLMSLLGIYVIIAYYSNATKNREYDNKITEQRFDVEYLQEQIEKLLSYQSSALHWNMSQIDNIPVISKRALDFYEKISQETEVKMHSHELGERRIAELQKGKDSFMKFSRNLAQMAQKRESVTIQPKEHLSGIKGTIKITNYLGGEYYFTSDEVKLRDKEVHLIDAKHTKRDKLPSLEDIKDGLLKMVLFTNLEDVQINNEQFNPVPILKLTTGDKFKLEEMTKSQKKLLEVLKKEAQKNNFKLLLNNRELICESDTG